MPTEPKTKIPFNIWTEHAKRHADLVETYAEAFVERRACGLKHPVHDFLFTYYSFSPQKLKQWVPTFQQALILSADGLKDYPWLSEKWFCIENDLLCPNMQAVPTYQRKLAHFIEELCCKIENRTANFRCFGLHEWAMVYKSTITELRHQGYPLRLTPLEIATFIESQTLCCTHYDAYRFFTPAATPLNALKPTLSSRLQLEQGGCLHANMDLYKWATKLWPWVGSDFIARTFHLALNLRELDMRASPYDLVNQGYTPICIETAEGRNHYQSEQKKLAESAHCLRKELVVFCKNFCMWYGGY
jgi:hypothetical protein